MLSREDTQKVVTLVCKAIYLQRGNEVSKVGEVFDNPRNHRFCGAKLGSIDQTSLLFGREKLLRIRVKMTKEKNRTASRKRVRLSENV